MRTRWTSVWEATLFRSEFQRPMRSTYTLFREVHEDVFCRMETLLSRVVCLSEMQSSLRKLILIMLEGQLSSQSPGADPTLGTVEWQEHCWDCFSSHRNTFILTRDPPRTARILGELMAWAVGISYIESLPKWTVRDRPEQVLSKHWCKVLHNLSQNAPKRDRSELCSSVHLSELLVGACTKRKQK